MSKTCAVIQICVVSSDLIISTGASLLRSHNCSPNPNVRRKHNAWIEPIQRLNTLYFWSAALLTACNLVCSIFSIWCAWSALNVAPPHTTGCVNNQQCSRDCLSKIAVEVLTWLGPFTRILPSKAGNGQNNRSLRQQPQLLVLCRSHSVAILT